jgi:hypothetical protein
MPGIMFQDVVCSRAQSNRKWYTLPLSFLVHTSVLAVLIVVPLVATDVLPRPRAIMEFVTPYVPVVPTPPSRPEAPPLAPGSAASAPVVAPDTIRAESGVIFKPGHVETGSIDGIIGGVDVGQIAVDAPPPVAAAPVPSGPVRVGDHIKPPLRIKGDAGISRHREDGESSGNRHHRSRHRHRWHGRTGASTSVAAAARRGGSCRRAGMGVHADAAEWQTDGCHHDRDGEFHPDPVTGRTAVAGSKLLVNRISQLRRPQGIHAVTLAWWLLDSPGC